MKKITLPLLSAIFTFASFSQVIAQNTDIIIKDYIIKSKLKEFKKTELVNFVVDIVDPSTSLKGDVVKINQTYLGLPIYNSTATALLRDKRVIYFSDNFVKDFKNTISSSVPTISSVDALTIISNHLGKDEVRNYSILNATQPEGDSNHFAKQKLVFAEVDGILHLAYEFALPDPESSSFWIFLVDAKNGNIISHSDLNLSCNFHHDAFSHDDSQANLLAKSFIGPEFQNNSTSQWLAPDAATYNVFPLPIEAASFGSRTRVTNPWISTSSPEGWHYDGTNRYNNTRGNNVYAYEDSAATNAVGSSADGGASRNFDFPFNLNGSAVNNRNAAITNLFYVNNMIHDIFYKFGFTETSRNFQQHNFNLGGNGNDYVNAEAQDGGGTNNANFSSPADGTKPRMQMYLWSTRNQYFFYNAPTSSSGRKPSIGTANFGPALNATGVTANVQLSSVQNGCTALPTGSLTGKIGLVERGDCSFVIKTKNLQNAGANAVIIYNSATNGDTLSNMSGTDSTVTIPSVLITKSEGDYIKSLLASNTTVNVTLKNDPTTAITPDGSFDNGIIIHEYGHGISNRLTGTGSNCLNRNTDKEQMGEGWSDFFALMLTNRPNANATVARGIGTYATGESNDGYGIRPAKYSPNFLVNDYTYGDTNGMEYLSGVNIVPDVHSIGFIWATMLWDLHWNYVDKYGYSEDVTANANSGSARVLQLVTNGLKLQVCNPSFIEGRDAILAAELAATNGEDKCMIWRTFARRGLGVNASAGLKNDINDQVEDFTVPAECSLGTNEVKSVKNSVLSVYPNPAKEEFFIKFPAGIMGKVNIDIYDMSGKLVQSESKVSPDSKKSYSTQNLTDGVYVVKINGLGVDSSAKLIIKK